MCSLVFYTSSIHPSFTIWSDNPLPPLYGDTNTPFSCHRFACRQHNDLKATSVLSPRCGDYYTCDAFPTSSLFSTLTLSPRSTAMVSCSIHALHNLWIVFLLQQFNSFQYRSTLFLSRQSPGKIEHRVVCASGINGGQLSMCLGQAQWQRMVEKCVIGCNDINMQEGKKEWRGNIQLTKCIWSISQWDEEEGNGQFIDGDVNWKGQYCLFELW